MKNLTLLLLSTGLLLSAARLHSQAPAENPSPAAIMAAMKATNADTLTRQAATLQTLEKLAEDASQIKIFAKRG